MLWRNRGKESLPRLLELRRSIFHDGLGKGQAAHRSSNELGRWLVAPFIPKRPEVQAHLTLSDSGLDVLDFIATKLPAMVRPKDVK